MKSEKNWDLKIKRSIGKFLDRMPPRDARNVVEVMNSLVADPFRGDVKKIHGREDVWRRRVGSYRIFYKVQQSERIVLVFDVERRSSQTYAG
jgi:mRNA-degrading endonuclease RelE of RelBE toxin-antitoxin system